MSAWLCSTLFERILTIIAETVIAVMLRSFKFSLSKREIYWNLAGVYFPTEGKESSKPAAYLRLDRIEE